MKKYEYQIIGDLKGKDDLNEEGLEGWELCTSFVGGLFGTIRYYIFKRELLDNKEQLK